MAEMKRKKRQRQMKNGGISWYANLRGWRDEAKIEEKRVNLRLTAL